MRNTDTEPGGSVDVSKAREVLPANVKPIHYDLTLEPDFENFSYEGTVIIECVATAMVDNLDVLLTDAW